MPTLYVEGNTKIPTTSHNENQKVQVIEKDLHEPQWWEGNVLTTAPPLFPWIEGLTSNRL